jgi:SAM-dependent methyltransferase
MDREILANLAEYIPFRGHSLLELGCGRGILSRFAMEQGAASATLVDSSGEALQLARRVLADMSPIEFVQGDLLAYRSSRKFDIVLSSGVLEHFRGQALMDCLRVHADHACGLVAIIVPTTPHANEYHCRTRRFVDVCGYERPISALRMRRLLVRAGMKPLLMRRFFPLYNVGAYWTLPRTAIGCIDRELDRKLLKLDASIAKRHIRDRVIPRLRRLDSLLGGLLLAVARPR